MKLALRIFLSAAMAAAAFAQNQPAAQMNTIQVGADGKFEAAPDLAVFQFFITAQEKTSPNAYNKVTTGIEQVRQVLKANGVDPVAAEFGHYAIHPILDWKEAKRKVIAYRVTASIRLKLRDFSKIGPLIEQLADITENQNQSLKYVLENVESAKKIATEDAFNKALSRAQTVAKAAGRNLADLQYASVDVAPDAGQTREVLMEDFWMRRDKNLPAAAQPTEDFSPQLITVSAHVNAVFGLK